MLLKTQRDVEVEVTAEDFHAYCDVQRSGVTNMFGASPYLMNAFGLDKREAREVLSAWMKSY